MGFSEEAAMENREAAPDKSEVFALNIALLLVKWLIPPTVIAIGDEIARSKKAQELREYVLWSIIVAAIVGIGVNLVTR